MASNNSSHQPLVEAAANPEQMAESKAGDDDPGTSIQKILGIVEKLHTFFLSQTEKEKEKLTKTKSMSTSTQATATSIPPRSDATLTSALSGPPASGPTGSLKDDETENSIPKLQRNLRLLKEDVVKLKDLNQEVGEEVKKHICPLNNLLQKVAVDNVNKKLTKGNKKDLEDINKKIFNLMCQVPLLPNKRKKNKGSEDDDGGGDNNGKGIVCLPGIHTNEEDLKRLAVFRQVRDEFKNLENDRKICLLSFAVFPENQKVNRTMLMYWWIGENILPVSGAENAVKEILNDFTKKKLIEPVENKCKVEPNTYKMTPFVHSSVVLISKEIGLFDMYHKGEKPTMKQSKLNKVCLVEDSSNQPEAKAKKMPADNIETVFNVSERFPDFTFKWFSEDQPSSKKKFGLSKTTYKALKVFYLGRWERTAKRHIEVENPDLMKYLRHMTKLRLLSFQGISRIEKLDDAVCKLRELIILDLRACYNLEKLPDKIDSLKALIYLDITDCYMIDRMPKRLSWLDNLEVLKGFVVSDADEETVCTLVELKHLKKLRKLSITINKDDFSVEDLFGAIGEFENLEKFKVAWGGINKHKKEETGVGTVKTILRSLTHRGEAASAARTKKIPQPKLPEKLKKLDLQCFPDPVLPSWLEPNRLVTLEKLYIKGGTELTGFGKLYDPEVPTKCSVKILRLKFLPRLKVEWRELSKVYFPQLEFLEKYQCPQVSLCPCDGIGIWRKPLKN